jgi:hypothetical protein
MGQDNPAVKQLLLAFGDNAVTVDVPTGVHLPVWLFDHTCVLKYPPTKFDAEFKHRLPVTTGHEYVTECVVRALVSAYKKGAVMVYCCFDRGSPINKSIEHEKRYKNVTPMETPPNHHNEPALLNDYRMPGTTKKEWDSFIANPYLYRRMIHYITMRLIGTRGNIEEELLKYVRDAPKCDYNDELNDFTIDPYGSKMLLLHGGRLKMPEPNRPKFYRYSEPFLLEFRTETSEVELSRSGSSTTRAFETKRSVRINRGYDPNVIHNILEGEVAAVHYAQSHIEQCVSVVVVTPDIDVLMQYLLTCEDRIDPATGKFVCTVLVCLKVASDDSLTRYVDVHKVWYNMHFRRPARPSKDISTFRSSCSHEYVTKICALLLLCGTDYVKKYCQGIKNKKGGFGEAFIDETFGSDFKTTTAGKKVTALLFVPWVVYVFLKYVSEFENMITITRTTDYDKITRIRSDIKVDIDEELFIAFTRRVYVERYTCIDLPEGKAFRKKYGDKTSVKNVRRFLNEDKKKALDAKLATEARRDMRLATNPDAKRPKKIINTDRVKAMNKIKRNRMMPARKIRVSSRHLLWQIEYMANGFKSNCAIVDPTSLYKELPYYGWVLDGEGKCRVAARVSLKRPNVNEIKKRRVADRRLVALRAFDAGSKWPRKGSVDNDPVFQFEDVK